jgi:hypothetical protein
MVTEQQREEILKAGDEVRRTKVAYDAALVRFDAAVDALQGGTASSQKTPKRIGKVPNPRSLAQRVLAALTANGGPLKVDAMAEQFKKSNKEIRNAIVYHQKKGAVIRVGEGTYDLKVRENGSGHHTVEQPDLNP